MKRDLSVITDEVRKLIQKWLNNEDYEECPFNTKPCLTICKIIFPTLPERLPRIFRPRWPLVCPCDAYGKTYVIKIAKEIIRCPQK